MRHRLTVREPEINLTDEQIERLPEPYALLALWIRHAPLAGLVRLDELVCFDYLDNDDGTATMHWSDAVEIDQDIVAPLMLARRTTEFSKKQRRPGPIRPLFRDEAQEPILAGAFIARIHGFLA
jgi:hypothetical protein